MLLSVVSATTAVGAAPQRSSADATDLTDPPASTTSALVGDRNDTSYAIAGLGNATVRVQPEPAGPVVTDDGNPARDSDSDGLHEDIDGDGTTNILDVARLLDTV